MYRNDDDELMVTKEDDIVFTFLALDVLDFLGDVVDAVADATENSESQHDGDEG